MMYHDFNIMLYLGGAKHHDDISGLLVAWVGER